MKKIGLAKRIHQWALKHGKEFTCDDIYRAFPNELKHTIRARIYTNLSKDATYDDKSKKYFRRLSNGKYKALKGAV